MNIRVGTEVRVSFRMTVVVGRGCFVLGGSRPMTIVISRVCFGWFPAHDYSDK